MTVTVPDSLVTIPAVTLVEVGEWNASTGPVEFTSDDLRAAIAALDDPAVHNPRLRIGHTSPDVTIQDSAGGFDEQPCFGKFTNLRLNGDASAIVADMVGVPGWLAELLPIAYPSRSIEGYWNVKTASGKEHDFVISAVALLGVSAPAVETLEDLAVLFSTTGPDGVELVEGTRVAASRGGAQMPTKVDASTSVTDIRRAFYEDFATEESGRYWWWIYEMYADPPALIVSDDTDAFYLVSYSTSGSAITFAEPVEVLMQWIEKDNGKVAAQAFMRRSKNPFGDALASFATAADSRPQDRVKAETQPEPKEDEMSIDIKALRERLGLTEEQLPDDATEEQVNEILAETPGPDPTPDPEPDPAPDPVPDPEPTAVEPEPEPVAATISVDKGVWDETQRQAREGAAARAEQVTERRESILSDAVKAGKIAPASKDAWRKKLVAAAEATEAEIEALPKGLVNFDEVGSQVETPEAEMTQIMASFGRTHRGSDDG